MSTTLDLLTDALEDIGACGLEPPKAEDLAKALRKYNQLVGNWNTRERFKRFERMQTFAVTTSAQSYSIGATADAPTFVVTTGKRPVKISRANWIFYGTEPRRSEALEIIDVQEYAPLNYKALTNAYPCALYYQTTVPNGTMWLYPYPTSIVDSLQLFWWDQLETVLIENIALELNLPPGLELAITLTLSEMLCIPFGKERSAQLKEDASKARADYQSLNVRPPKLDTTGAA